MSSRPFDSPWPAPTPVFHDSESKSSNSPPRKRSLKRKRVRDEATGSGSTSKTRRRQVVVDKPGVDKALEDCQIHSGNAVISCFPSSNTVVAQHQWISFVWNSRRPELTQFNVVDIFLFHGDSRQQILNFTGVPNPTDQAGRINTQVDDMWWGKNGGKWKGKNISYPFYWVMKASGDQTAVTDLFPQPTFTAVQTTLADFVVSSMSSASVASVSAASAASASAAAATLSPSVITSFVGSPAISTSTASVQSGATSKDFPHWAIAVIVVLGFLAIVATCVLVFLIIRRVRRRNSDLDSNRHSIGSTSPMMANVGGQSSPLLTGAALSGGSVTGHDGPGGARDAHSVLTHDGASAISAGNEGPFSGADAAIMADAFRKMLRKPDFAARPLEEGESPDGPDNEEGRESIIGRELAEEGRDIRSVSSERGVRVETLSDSGDAAQDRLGKRRG